ncbi:MAG: hypothetical protein ACHQXG_01025 [Nitrososphaerales archaeon]
MKVGKVTPIIVPEDQLEYLINDVLNSNRYTPYHKEAIQRKITGFCCICREVPSMQVSYSLEGATRIERYCNKCIKNVFAREAVL